MKHLLMDMINDIRYRIRCIEKYSSIKIIRPMLITQQRKQEEDELWKFVRAVYSTLSIMNIITVFIIFGGSKTLTVVALFYSSLMYVSVYMSPSKAIR
ncbi:unnamed protein product [Adineta steineri]|uniref:Uncharacterized protein n=1 Tax=Adineta steineri TaxID=433720 RepID=A0A813MRJ0_9BILA|nr:unnamed protein product [Adineta steineri]CAF0840056.1 unnamed protein product [Adineta steineri]CAF0909548.1 unnamed protein product [Adineta steineri]